MTIAIAVKVGDGLVLGADSASTLSGDGGVANVYFNAEKICNLVKGLPIGMVTYGLGGLGGRSITALAKDLRDSLTNGSKSERLDPAGYTMQWVSRRVRKFFYEERYLKEYPKKIRDAKGNEIDVWHEMGFFVAGFSATADHAEFWQVEIDAKGHCGDPVLILDQSAAGKAIWAGVPEPLNRLFHGWSAQVANGLMLSGVPASDVQRFLNELPVEQLVQPAMPIQDAIDLVKYMIDVTVGWVRFVPGPPMVAEPADVAAVTKHEGFRWVRRKHYYSSELNPTLPVTKMPADSDRRGAPDVQ